MSSQNSLKVQLPQLFREAGSSHHQAFLATNGDDPEWPLWYAEFLLKSLNSFLGTHLTKSELVYHLVKVEKDRSKDRAATDWPTYYARYFIDLSPNASQRFTKTISG
jgi:hypothetical protein